MVDDAPVTKATGKSLGDWSVILDERGARRLLHKEIARIVHDDFDVPGWRSQMVTGDGLHLSQACRWACPLGRGDRQAVQQGRHRAVEELLAGVPVRALNRAPPRPSRSDPRCFSLCRPAGLRVDSVPVPGWSRIVRSTLGVRVEPVGDGFTIIDFTAYRRLCNRVDGHAT
jgi:hypothetical protein